MNVLVLNRQQNQLQALEVDIIKSVTGSFEVREIIDMFKNFFYNKMILDVTALKGYDRPNTYKLLAEGLNPDKIIFFLPEGSDLCTSGFLSRLIDYGIYNFTTNLDGVKYLIRKSNSYRDVADIKEKAENYFHNYQSGYTGYPNNNRNNFDSNSYYNNRQNNFQNNYSDNSFNNRPNSYNNMNNDYYESNNMRNNQNDNHRNDFQGNDYFTGGPFVLKNNNRASIIGFLNVTSHAGATSLIYMLKNELATVYGNKVIAIELEKNDFASYGDRQMISTTSNELRRVLERLSSASVILIDLNESQMNDICDRVIYLIEPSTIKINTLIRKNRNIITSLKDKEVILNKSLLSEKDISEFEYESGIHIFYTLPPLNDRKRNDIIFEFLKRLNLIKDSGSKFGSNGIFGLFRK